MTALAILLSVPIILLAIWSWGVAGQSIRERFKARREMKRTEREKKETLDMIADAFRESQERQDRYLERERRRAREERRAA